MPKDDDKKPDDAGKDDDKKGTGVSQENFDKLVATVGGLTKGITAIQTGMVGMQQRAADGDAAQKKADEEAAAAAEDADVGDLEQMSRADFANYIGDNIVKTLQKEMLDPLNKKIEGIETTSVDKDIKMEVKELSGEHKDFWDWKSEMGEIAKATPGITLKRAYKLARSENPDKAKELDDKHKDTSGDKDEKAKGFGGLTPTSSATSKSTKMDQATAVESAWDETMEGLEDFQDS